MHLNAQRSAGLPHERRLSKKQPRAILVTLMLRNSKTIYCGDHALDTVRASFGPARSEPLEAIARPDSAFFA